VPDLRVIVVSDDPLARVGLSALLADQDGIAVVAISTTGAALVEMVSAAQADVVLWDCGGQPDNDLTDSNLTTLADARDALPPVVALADDGVRASAAFGAGARGVLRRDAGPRK
jgi:DNA-binding NarL/FixJ family response regulator